MNPANIRLPVVAGSFYPATAEAIKKQISSFIDGSAEKINAIAALLPHAGYAYSGKVAAQTASLVTIKDTVILLGPNHTGYGTPFSIITGGAWQTPLGKVEIDAPLAQEFLKSSGYLQEDSLAHQHEHSLEVELPILQYFKTGFKIVPIAIASDNLGILQEVGSGIAEAVTRSGRKDSVVLIASSDMTHYEPQRQAQEKDKIAIQAILELDEEALFKKVKKHGISMCGYAPAVVMLAAAKKLGAKNARLVKYQTSGDVTQDKTSVVGYAGLLLY